MEDRRSLLNTWAASPAEAMWPEPLLDTPWANSPSTSEHSRHPRTPDESFSTFAQACSGRPRRGSRPHLCLVLLPTAWCLRNEGVSSVLLGASNAEQLMENIGAIQVRFGALFGAQVAPAFLETQLHWTPFQEYRTYRDDSEPCLCRAGPHRIRLKCCEWVCRATTLNGEAIVGRDAECRGQRH